MRIDITKDWCNQMAQLEADSEIGAGACCDRSSFRR